MADYCVPVPQDLGDAVSLALVLSARFGHDSEEAKAAWERAYALQESYRLKGWPFPPRAED